MLRGKAVARQQELSIRFSARNFRISGLVLVFVGLPPYAFKCRKQNIRTLDCDAGLLESGRASKRAGITSLLCLASSMSSCNLSICFGAQDLGVASWANLVSEAGI